MLCCGGGCCGWTTGGGSGREAELAMLDIDMDDIGRVSASMGSCTCRVDELAADGICPCPQDCC